MLKMCCLFDSGDVWSKDVCEAAVRDHRDDLTKLMEPDVVANYLISAGVFSSSDREDISSADNKCIRLLDKIEEKGAYQELFSVLHQTGPQLPAHGKLWEILNKSCDGMCSTHIDKVGAVCKWYCSTCNDGVVIILS